MAKVGDQTLAEEVTIYWTLGSWRLRAPRFPLVQVHFGGHLWGNLAAEIRENALVTFGTLF